MPQSPSSPTTLSAALARLVRVRARLADWVRGRAAPTGDDAALIALRRSDEQLRHAERVAQLGSFDWNPQTGALHWSDEHFRLWGHEPGAVVPNYQVFRAGVHPLDIEMLEVHLQRALQGGRIYDVQHRVCWPDGTVRDIQGRGEVTFDASGQAVRMIGTVQDVTERVQVRAQLAASVENLRRTLNATGDAIFASDAHSPNDPVLFVNDRMLQMWGIPPELSDRLTPATIMAYAAPQFADPQAQARRVAEIIASGEPAEERIELRDGRVLMRRCEPTRDPGRSVRVWGFRDITAEERAVETLRRSEALHSALLDAFPGYIACLDAQLRYTYVSERLARLLGTRPENMMGRALGEAEGTVRNEQTEGAVRRALAGQTEVTERILPKTAFRGETALLVTLAPGIDPRTGQTLCYTFSTDITRLKQTERALLTAKLEAERANRAKSQFLSSMSHELRTPMNAVLGFGQLLEADPGLQARERDYVKEILRGGRHLLSLINDLLDLARIEAGSMSVSLEAVDPLEVVHECLSLVRPLAEQRGIVLHGPLDDAPVGAVLADRTRLRQVLLNLLGNAIKYNRDRGQVWVTLEDRGDVRRLGVRDTGPGLDERNRDRLFLPFERLGAETTAVEGAGIGLALSRRLVSMMQGSIGVDSEPGRGSTFWLELAPAATPATTGFGSRLPLSPACASPGAPAQAAQRTVLYIEDNPVNILLMEAMLGRLPDVRLVTATHPRLGLAKARELLPDLIMLDIQLPDMDGYEVLEQLRAHADTAAIPVFAVSANAMDPDVARGREAGFDDYLTKPLDMPRLHDAVGAVLRRLAAP